MALLMRVLWWFAVGSIVLYFGLAFIHFVLMAALVVGGAWLFFHVLFNMVLPRWQKPRALEQSSEAAAPTSSADQPNA